MDKILYWWLLKQLKYAGGGLSVVKFRRFVYDILALTKYKITTLLVVLSIYTNVLYKM